MPNHKSAEKRMRQNETRHARNQHFKSTVKNRIKALREALSTGDAARAAELLPVTVRQIDKVASKGILPKKRASRLVGRLSKAVHQAQQGA